MAPILHLLKSGRVLQYRHQNVALVSAPVGSTVAITYAQRWLEPGISISPGDDAVVVLADSPYTRFDPIRFATITAVDATAAGVELTTTLGAYAVVTDEDALREPSRRHPDGAPWFCWRAPADVRAPRSQHEELSAWRKAVDRLGDNDNYAQSRFARLVAVLDRRAAEVRDEGMELGDTATAVIEVRSPADPDRTHDVIVHSDPAGMVAGGVDDERVDPQHHLSVPIRPLTGGSHQIELWFSPDPLLSTRLSFEIRAHRATRIPDRAGSPAPGAVDDAPADHARAILGRLRRLDGVEPRQWLDLIEDHLVPLAPDDAVLRSMAADVAFSAGEHELVVALLDEVECRPADSLRRVLSGLFTGAPTDVASLVRTIDVEAPATIAAIRAAAHSLGDDAVGRLAEAVCNEIAGPEVIDRLLAECWHRLDDELAQRVAGVARLADPDGWLDRVLDRWPRPDRTPGVVLDALVTWAAEDERLGAHLIGHVEGSGQACGLALDPDQPG